MRNIIKKKKNVYFSNMKKIIIHFPMTDRLIVIYMIKADREGKASGLENVRPYHRMESMRKSNILS